MARARSGSRACPLRQQEPAARKASPFCLSLTFPLPASPRPASGPPPGPRDAGSCGEGAPVAENLSQGGREVVEARAQAHGAQGLIPGELTSQPKIQRHNQAFHNGPQSIRPSTGPLGGAWAPWSLAACPSLPATLCSRGLHAEEELALPGAAPPGPPRPVCCALAGLQGCATWAWAPPAPRVRLGSDPGEMHFSACYVQGATFPAWDDLPGTLSNVWRCFQLSWLGRRDTLLASRGWGLAVPSASRSAQDRPLPQSTTQLNVRG